MDKICWLHVSDFHLKAGDRYDQDVVLGALVKSVRTLRERRGRKPDLIFATGDIANFGKAAEYKLASPFFDALLAAAGLERRSLFLVPGNHDVDRDQGTGLAETLDTCEKADSYFKPGGSLPHLERKLGAFRKWYNSYFKGIRELPKDSSCGPVESIDIGGQRIAVLPLNSALFSHGNSDQNKLLIGRRCLKTALEQVQQHAAQLRIALIHHPLDWLSHVESQNITADLQSSIDIILHGHLHENSVASVASPHGTTLMLAAGASYQTRQWPNRAMFVTVEGSTARVFPLRYEDSPTEIWTLDTSLFPHDKDYEGEFPLPGRQSPQPATSAQAFTLPGAKPAPETPSDQPNTLEVRIQGQLCAELAKDTCLPITGALLGSGDEGHALQEKIAAWWAGGENTLQRIKALTAAVSEALQPKPPAPQAFLAHAQKLLGLVALGALRPEALADLAGDAGALRELAVETVVGVELVSAARGGLDTIVFVLAGENGKRVHPERALVVEPKFPESAWDATRLAKDAADQIVRPLLDIPASQHDLSMADYDHAAAALRDKGAYFAVSRLASPGHPLLDAAVRAALPEQFRDFPIMVFGINARERSKLFNVREGELRHAIQTFLETLRGHNPN